MISIMPKIVTDNIKIESLLSRGTEEVIEIEHLKERLLSGERLRVKFGIDPTGTVLHFGHSLPLRKMQQFLDLGHEVVLLIGDFTATIGDPSGRLEERSSLSREEVKKNMKEYLKQASRVLNIKKTEIRYNSEWYDKKKAKFFMELASRFTYARLMDRAEFKERIKSGGDITLLELTYPLLQGYDSVELKADVEIGGTDQKFNLLMGRKVQKRYNMREQDIMTMPLLVGTDGVKKMSKTYGNYIALTDSATDMFAKIMSIPDSLVSDYLALLTNLPLDEIKKEQKLAGSDVLESKKRLAQNITEQFWGAQKTQEVKNEFDRVFSHHELPQEIEEIKVATGKKSIVDLIFEAKIESSRGEIKRLIEQGAVKINDKTIDSWNEEINIGDQGVLIKIGPRRFYKLKIN